jgi:hypothetical protein
MTQSTGLLFRTMQHLGLRNTGIVHWTRVLQNGTSARVRVNGFLSPPFAVREVSLPQGGASSQLPALADRGLALHLLPV